MGGVVYVTPYASSVDNALLNQTAANIQGQMYAAAMANQQAAMNQYQRAADPMAYERAMQASVLNQGVRGVDTRSVPSTAASRVQKAEWELEYDRKDREVDEMIERQRQERERIAAEEQYGSDRDQANSGSDEGH